MVKKPCRKCEEKRRALALAAKKLIIKIIPKRTTK